MPTTIDIAAGGLLESSSSGQLQIAVIHRGRYDDWTLPKGHLDPGESIEEAALREVREETGCVAEIVEIVQPVSYLVNDQPKIVVYFRMRLLSDEGFTPSDEVSAVAWMTPSDACSRLSYQAEMALVADLYEVLG